MTGRAGGEFYVSVDVETDGPIPGDCNMVSVGASVCGATLTDGNGFRRVNGSTFYRELTTEFPGDPDTRRWLTEQGFELNSPQAVGPKTAMRHFKEWIEEQASEINARPVYVAYPLGFDWSFTHWYFEHYLGPKSDPFGFSNALDIKTFFSAKSGRALLGSLKRNMPRSVKTVEQPHTHNAKDDAVGQGELFANLMEWNATRKYAKVRKALAAIPYCNDEQIAQTRGALSQWVRREDVLDVIDYDFKGDSDD